MSALPIIETRLWGDRSNAWVRGQDMRQRFNACCGGNHGSTTFGALPAQRPRHLRLLAPSSRRSAQQIKFSSQLRASGHMHGHTLAQPERSGRLLFLRSLQDSLSQKLLSQVRFSTLERGVGLGGSGLGGLGAFGAFGAASLGASLLGLGLALKRRRSAERRKAKQSEEESEAKHGHRQT